MSSANLLYLLSMGLIVVVGAWLQSWQACLALILTEVGVILLPTLLFLRVVRAPVRETLRTAFCMPASGRTPA